MSVTSLSAVRAERSRRKEERKVARRAGGVDGGGAQLEKLLGTFGLDGALQIAAEAQLDARAAPPVSAAAGSGSGAPRHSLPEGTVREVFDSYETVSVPPAGVSERARAAKAARPRADVRLLEPLVQRVLAGVSALNPMQTAVHSYARERRGQDGKGGKGRERAEKG